MTCICITNAALHFYLFFKCVYSIWKEIEDYIFFLLKYEINKNVYKCHTDFITDRDCHQTPLMKEKDENKIIGFHISYFKIKLKVQTVTSRSLHSRNEGKFSTDLSLHTWAGCCVVRVTVINLSPSCLSITTPNKAIYATCNFRL